jgi:predicted histone-like DNA-binding protein
MSVLYKKYQNKNSKSRAYQKWYGKSVAMKTMSYRELVKHISEHNTVYGEDVCLGVANKLQKCIIEQLMESKKVQFGELGTFYLSMSTEGAESKDKFAVGQNVKGLYLRFAPSRTDINNLSSKMLKKTATFQDIEALAGTSEEEPEP